MERPAKPDAGEQWLFVQCDGPKGRKQTSVRDSRINRHVQPRLGITVSKTDGLKLNRLQQDRAQSKVKSRACRVTTDNKANWSSDVLGPAVNTAIKAHHQGPEDHSWIRTESTIVWDDPSRNCPLCNLGRKMPSATTLCSTCAQITGLDVAIQEADNSRCTRSQLLSFFVDDFQTLTNDRIQRYRHPTFWTELLGSEIKEAPLLTNAVEAVTLSHMAEKTRSPKVESLAREAYGKWIQMLARAVDNPTVRRFYTTRSVVLSIFTMGLMALFPNPVTSGLDHGVWSSHVWASQKFLGASGPEGLDFTRKTDRVICHNLKAASLCLGVSKRKEFLAETPEWIQFFQIYYRKQKDAGNSVWQHDVENLPRLLHLVDTAMDDATAEGVSEQLRAIRLKSQLSVIPEEKTFVSLQKDFNPSIEEQVFLIHDRTFPSYYTFQDPKDWDHNRLTWLVWCIDIILDCTILRLHKRTGLHGGVTSPEFKSAEQRVFIGTRFFCRSIWYMSTFDTLAAARWMDVCQKMARNVFESLRSQASKELKFTNECGAATEARVQRLLNEGRLSLCPVGDLSAGFASACTW